MKIVGLLAGLGIIIFGLFYFWGSFQYESAWVGAPFVGLFVILAGMSVFIFAWIINEEDFYG